MKHIHLVSFPPPYYPQAKWDAFTIELYYSQVDEPQPHPANPIHAESNVARADHAEFSRSSDRLH